MRIRSSKGIASCLLATAGGSFALAATSKPSFTPISVRKGDRIFQLRSFKTFVNPKNLNEEATTDSPWESIARFSITEKGRPAPWRPVELSVSDGKGKRWAASHYYVRMHRGEPEFVFGLRQPGKNWRDYSRPALDDWNLRVEFSRTSAFKTDELWTVKNVPLPIPGQDTPKGAIVKGKCNGVALQLLKLLPAGANFGESVPLIAERTGATLVLEPRREGLRADLVSVIDNMGRKVQADLVGGGSGGCCINVPDPTERYHFEFANLAADARSVNLTFAVHKSEFIQFKVRPTTPIDLANGLKVAAPDGVTAATFSHRPSAP